MNLNLRNIIALNILESWGYHNVTVGDLDGRNFEAKRKELSKKSWYRPKNMSHKTQEAVKHAYRLADISIQCMVMGSV